MTKTKLIRMSADDPRLANADIASVYVWRDCNARFRGDMPEGWTWQIAYWDRTPTIIRWSAKQWRTRPYQDVALCPDHTRALNALYKDVGNAVDNVTVGLRSLTPDALDDVLDAMKPAGRA